MDNEHFLAVPSFAIHLRAFAVEGIFGGERWAMMDTCLKNVAGEANARADGRMRSNRGSKGDSK
jgi:hypothetical protein